MTTPERRRHVGRSIELTPTFDDAEAIFTITHLREDLVIDWNGYKDAAEVLEQKRPQLERDRRRHLTSDFTARAIGYEAMYLILGTSFVPGGTFVDVAGGVAVAGTAGYHARRAANNGFEASVKKLSKRTTLRETDPSRRIVIPPTMVPLVDTTSLPDGPSLDSLSTDVSADTLNLITSFVDRHPDSGIITTVDPERYRTATEELEQTRQKKMEIYIRRWRKEANKPYDPERHFTAENYRKAKKELEYDPDPYWSDFSKKETTQLKRLKALRRRAKESLTLPPLDDQPTRYVDLQKIVALFAVWLNDRDVSMDALADIYEIAEHRKRLDTGDQLAFEGMWNAVDNLLQRAVYTT